MELKGKRIAILIEDMYNEFEFWYPYYRMKESGAGRQPDYLAYSG